MPLHENADLAEKVHRLADERYRLLMAATNLRDEIARQFPGEPFRPLVQKLHEAIEYASEE